MKYDGYRCLLALAGGEAKIYTRTGLDWTDKFPEIAEAAARASTATAPCSTARSSRSTTRAIPSFSALQEAISRGRARPHPVPVRRARDRRRGARQAAQSRAQAAARRPARRGPAAASSSMPTISSARASDCSRRCARPARKGSSRRRPTRPIARARTKNWLKIKCTRRQEFVIIGWTRERQEGPRLPRAAARRSTRAASCAMPARSAPASRQAVQHELRAKLDKLATDKAAGRGAPRRGARRALGEARAGRRDCLCRVHRRQCRAPRQLPRPARRQGGEGGGRRNAAGRCPSRARRRQDLATPTG